MICHSMIYLLDAFEENESTNSQCLGSRHYNAKVEERSSKLSRLKKLRKARA